MLRAVLFDLDNTLVDRDGAYRAFVEASFRSPAVRARLLRLDRGDRATLFAAWHRAGVPLDQEGLGEALARHLRPDPGLLAGLRALAAAFRVGIVTNGGGANQRRKLAVAGLDFVPAWISGEVGVAKPDPRIFLMACDGLGVPPGECLMVGDRSREDVEGARAAGMRAVQVHGALDGPALARLVAGLA